MSSYSFYACKITHKLRETLIILAFEHGSDKSTSSFLVNTPKRIPTYETVTDPVIAMILATLTHRMLVSERDVNMVDASQRKASLQIIPRLVTSAKRTI